MHLSRVSVPLTKVAVALAMDTLPLVKFFFVTKARTAVLPARITVPMARVAC
jgi:hypothetical protein